MLAGHLEALLAGVLGLHGEGGRRLDVDAPAVVRGEHRRAGHGSTSFPFFHVFLQVKKFFPPLTLYLQQAGHLTWRGGETASGLLLLGWGQPWKGP